MSARLDEPRPRAKIVGIGEPSDLAVAQTRKFRPHSRQGASAYVTKEESIEDLVRVSLAAADGQFLCLPRISRLMQERLSELAASRERSAGLERLSRREHINLRLLGHNLSNKQIARELGLEVSTIKDHVHNIIVKLSVKNRMQAATFSRPI
ncbi:response regulator transcription factor [Bradyrhizobium sp. CB3481]|uniref:LuxR C-terminal-related transcriptional regulator n=1 Tax=Bradyrhizobium sp. CB3481 TaxID=3039158 RepID=UPI0024B05CE8|nr:response regulator transcription factor [Bradyrhizobium sp. CB3481]WFU18408.1 response regulator transcription factor [Bradyrhizobium sp. CB3481]